MDPLVILLFLIALSSNLILITIFIIRQNGNYERVKKVGYGLFLMGFLAIIAIILVVSFGDDNRIIWFLGIFLAYLLLEILFDYIFKIDFRKNWKALIPYLILYYMANYSLVMMIWLYSSILGWIIVVLFIIQIIVNILTHKTPKSNAI